MSKFKWLEWLNKGDKDDPVLFIFTEQMFQENAESIIERPLSELELNRVYDSLIDSDEIAYLRNSLINEVIMDVINIENNNWSEIDETYLKKVRK